MSYWDGAEDFTHKEAAHEAASREENFGAWLEALGDGAAEGPAAAGAGAARA